MNDNKPHPKIRNDEFKDLVETIGKKGMGTAQPTREGKRDLSIPGWTVLHGKSVSFFREGDITLG